jgi:hypothetical protein
VLLAGLMVVEANRNVGGEGGRWGNKDGRGRSKTLAQMGVYIGSRLKLITTIRVSILVRWPVGQA